MTPTLYYSPGACSLAPHIILEEIGLPFRLAHVSTADGSTRAAEHFKLNPKGRLPVLVTGDSVLTEAPAILVHLAMQHPDKKLLASTPDALVRSMEWGNWLSGTVQFAIFSISAATSQKSAVQTVSAVVLRLAVAPQ